MTEKKKETELFSTSWPDDSRVAVLYAPFREKSINPVHWDCKMIFWKNLIKEWCRRKGYVFQIKTLLEDFRRNGKTPDCLKTVIEQMLQEEMVESQADFLNKKLNSSWSEWAVNNFVKRLSWTMTVLKKSLNGEEFNKINFVHVASLKELEQKLMMKVDSRKNVIFVEEKFIKLINEIREEENLPNLNEEAVKLLIAHLEVNNKVKTLIVDNNLLVKVSNNNSPNEMIISEAEIAIFKLELFQSSLTKDIEELDSKIQQIYQEAKEYVVNNRTIMAKKCLRKKKLLEYRLSQKVKQLENIEILSEKIADAETDSKVLELYQMGTQALQLISQETGLDKDKVFEKFSDMEEALDKLNTIESMMSSLSISENDEELNKELENLVSSELVKDFPVVPEDDLSPVKIKAKPVKNEQRCEMLNS